MADEEKKKKKRARATGLKWVHEVKSILEAWAYEVEGPGFKIMVFPDKRTREIKPIQVHRDYFGIWDLISWHPVKGYQGHQVSRDQDRVAKILEIQKSKKDGFFWGRDEENRKIVYRIYAIEKGIERTIGSVTPSDVFRSIEKREGL